MRKMSIIEKISFSALFIALGMILSRFVSLPYLFGLPFLKVSFQPSVTMFASFYLGPVWGLIVGTFTDVFGALLFPQGGEFNPLFTIPASLTGLAPYFMYRIFNNRFEKKYPISLTFILFTISLFLTIFFAMNDEIHSESGKRVYEIALWLKYTIGIGSFSLSAVFIVAVILIRNKFKNAKINSYYNIYTIATAIFTTYFIFKIPVSSLIKSFVLSYDFFFVFVVQCLVGFISCFIHIILCTIALNVSTFFNSRGALIKNSKILTDNNILLDNCNEEDKKDGK